LFNFEIVREPGTVATITAVRGLRETNQLTEVGGQVKRPRCGEGDEALGASGTPSAVIHSIGCGSFSGKFQAFDTLPHLGERLHYCRDYS